MTTNPDVRIDVRADTSDASRDLNNLRGDMRDTGREASRMGDHIDGAGSTASQAAGGLGDLGGALSEMGGPLGGVGAGMETLAPFVMGVTGAADLATVAMGALNVANIKSAAATALNTVKTAAQTAATYAAAAATQVWTGIQAAFNAVMAINPVVLVVIAIVALIAVVVIAYKKVDWFRAGVQKAWNAIKVGVSAAIAGVMAVIRGLVAFFGVVAGLITKAVSIYFTIITFPFRQAWEWISKFLTPSKVTGLFRDIGTWIGNAASSIFEAIKRPFQMAWDWIKTNIIDPIKNTWNDIAGLINGISFTVAIPSWVPKIGGKKWDLGDAIPNIPTLDSGGIVSRPTLALLAANSRPEAVIPLGRGGVGGPTIVNNIKVELKAPADPAEVGRQVVRAVQAYNRAQGSRALARAWGLRPA